MTSAAAMVRSMAAIAIDRIVAPMFAPRANAAVAKREVPAATFVDGLPPLVDHRWLD
jgi:hypothetical protein